MTHAARSDLLGCMRMLLLVDNFPSWEKCGRHGEGEVGVGIRLIFEGEMPPFFGVVVKSVLHHRVVQDFAIGFLLRCEPAGDIVGAIAEVVECTAHIHIL